jgi:hypothetical protein
MSTNARFAALAARSATIRAMLLRFVRSVVFVAFLAVARVLYVAGFVFDRVADKLDDQR